MLMQYFSYEELKDIKKQVIEQHCSQQQWDCAAEVLKGFSLWSQAEELQKAFKYADHEKTDYGEWVYLEMFRQLKCRQIKTCMSCIQNSCVMSALNQ